MELPKPVTSDLLIGVAVGVVIILLFAFLSCPFVETVFAKEYPVLVKGGALIITGASTGIGNHAAQHLAQNGFVVYAGVRKQKDADALLALGIPTLKPVILDVAKPSDIDSATKQVLAECEKSKTPLVAVINNAGIAQKFPLEHHPMEDMRGMFDIHVFGPMELIQKVLPTIRKNHGRIINLSSITALVILPTGAAYGSSKKALEVMSDGLRRELEDYNVSVSIIQPAFVDTAIFGKVTEKIDSQIELSPEIMNNYGFFFRPEKRAKDKRSVARASPPTVTTNAIYHALTSPYPNTRYIVANVDGKPAFILGWLVWICPDRLADFIMKRFS